MGTLKISCECGHVYSKTWEWDEDWLVQATHLEAPDYDIIAVQFTQSSRNYRIEDSFVGDFEFVE